ncbi:MAG: Ig-like domain-containing protein [Bacteroidales bacterium]|nr:Ig-like domain-containing protein [Bacteroidales bacterium]
MEKEFKCVNYANCKNADAELILKEHELEETDGKYLCPVCGRELEEITKKQPTWKPVAIICAAAAIIGGGAFGLIKAGVFETKSPAPTIIGWSSPEASCTLGKEAKFPTLAVSPEGLEIEFSSSDESVAQISQDGVVTPVAKGETTISATFAGSKKQSPASASYKLTVAAKPVVDDPPIELGWGRYKGPIKNRRPHGIQGVVEVTQYHTIDLKNGRNEYKRVRPGDQIVNCKFVNGSLVYGVIKYYTGEQEVINIGI